MNRRKVLFYFDYLDPLSYLTDHMLNRVQLADETWLVRLPFELRPPPEPMLDPADEAWRERWTLATEAASTLGLPLFEPLLLPWTRKAHELVGHAAEKGSALQVHRAIFEAALLRREDIGRVDVLVRVAQSHGLDPTEAKVVLDVDRHAQGVLEARARAIEAGVMTTPTLVAGTETLRGFGRGGAEG